MHITASGSLHRLAAVLCCLLVSSHASELNDAAWWSPANSIAKVYDFSDDFSVMQQAKPSLVAVEPSSTLRARKRAHKQDDLILLGEGETRARENATTELHHKANTTAEHGRVNGTGTANVAASVNVNNTATAAVAATSAATAEKGEKKQIPAEVRKTWGEWLRLTMSCALVIKALCMTSNILFQVSPLPVVKGFVQKCCTGDTDSAPFISIAYGSCQWCFYGLFAFIVTSKTGFLVLVYSNVFGAGLGMYYVYAFQMNCMNHDVRTRSMVYFQVLGTVAFVQVVAMMMLPAVRALFFSGLISSAWSIVGSMSMLTTVPTVLATKCAKTLPFPLLVAAEVSAVLWITCGVMLRDPWITVPNVASFMTCGFALSLCWYYPMCSVDDDLENEESEDMAPLVPETAESTAQIVPEHPSPLSRIIRTIRGGQDLDRPSSMAGYGTMKRTNSLEGCTAGTGETF